jgi:muramidase (phage lysozyme)
MFMLARSEANPKDAAQASTAATRLSHAPHDLKSEVIQLRTQIVKERQQEASRKLEAARQALHSRHVIENAAPTPTPTANSAPSATSIPSATVSPHSSASAPLPHTSHVAGTETLGIIPGSNATDAFTADWWRCVITPESGGRAYVTSGLYGILDSTWHAYHMSGHPGDYAPAIQEKVALEIYAANGGFGPVAWNNTAHCGKGG